MYTLYSTENRSVPLVLVSFIVSPPSASFFSIVQQSHCLKECDLKKSESLKLLGYFLLVFVSDELVSFSPRPTTHLIIAITTSVQQQCKNVNPLQRSAKHAVVTAFHFLIHHI
eukprot:TRINITY_DN64263_c1_g1_i3.p2 TRINITY_DN64263_c1_g1~~TRINITY_DN64263_c1_g1_i3.p2  ORF type:complete len:113 (-),score=6.24 TRINITY_DN64263_c1_g1_i3:86-424(-)